MLTSVRIPVDLVAIDLVDRCLREFEGGPSGEPGVIVPTEISVGGSA